MHTPRQHGLTQRRVLHTTAEAHAFLDDLEKQLEREGFTQPALFGIRLACDEALVNAIHHGNGGDDRKTVDVRYRTDPAGFVIRIEDKGDGFDPSAVPDPTLPENVGQVGGRGLHLMRHSMQHVRFAGVGNVVMLARSRAWIPPHERET